MAIDFDLIENDTKKKTTNSGGRKISPWEMLLRINKRITNSNQVR